MTEHPAAVFPSELLSELIKMSAQYFASLGLWFPAHINR